MVDTSSSNPSPPNSIISHNPHPSQPSHTPQPHPQLTAVNAVTNVFPAAAITDSLPLSSSSSSSSAMAVGSLNLTTSFSSADSNSNHHHVATITKTVPSVIGPTAHLAGHMIPRAMSHDMSHGVPHDQQNTVFSSVTGDDQMKHIEKVHTQRPCIHMYVYVHMECLG